MGVQQSLRFAVRVKPGAPREGVGGRWDAGSAPALRVSVTAAAVEGKANEAVRQAVAKAFGTRRQHVRLVTGERSRNKLVELDPAPPGAAERLAALLGSRDAGDPG